MFYTISVFPLLFGIANGNNKDTSMFAVPFKVSNSHSDSCGLAGTPIQTSTVSSEQDCTLHCFSDPQCVGYNWQESGSSCELFGIGLDGWENLTPQNGIKYVAMRETKSQV